MTGKNTLGLALIGIYPDNLRKALTNLPLRGCHPEGTGTTVTYKKSKKLGGLWALSANFTNFAF